MILVWLEWNISSFRLNDESFAYLAKLAPKGAEIRRARSEREFLASLPEADIVLTWEFRREWYALAKRMKVLATPAAGREFISQDVPPGVTLHHGRFHGAIMAETVLALMYAWCRGIVGAPAMHPTGRAARASGAKVAHLEGVSARRDTPMWPRRALSERCYTLSGTRAVILGYGNVGRAIGRRLEANGVSVKGIGRHNFGELDGALPDADWLVLALPGDTGTDNLVDARVLRMMKKSAVVVNVGRGNAIDEKALLSALKRGRIAAALLDVFKEEPLDESSPMAADLPNLVRLPHASAFSPKYLPMFFDELKECGLLAVKCERGRARCPQRAERRLGDKPPCHKGSGKITGARHAK